MYLRTSKKQIPVNFDSASNLISENEPFSSPDVEGTVSKQKLLFKGRGIRGIPLTSYKIPKHKITVIKWFDNDSNFLPPLNCNCFLISDESWMRDISVL